MAEINDPFNEFNDINYFNDFLEKLRNGDDKAWYKFNKEFGKYIRGQVQKIVLDKDAQEDILQEILNKVFRYIPNCRAQYGLPSFLQWLKLIIRTTCADYYKNKDKERNKTTYADIEKLNTKKDEREYNKHEKLQNALEECFKKAFNDNTNENDLILKQIIYFSLEGKRPREIRKALDLTEGSFEYQRNLSFDRIRIYCTNLKDFFPEN